MERRRFLELSGLGLVGVGTGCLRGPDASPDGACALTDADIEGPFWEPGVPIRGELDLYDDDGEALILTGIVRDRDCAPLSGAVVDLWHADPDGGYDASAELRYRGQVAADADGRYRFVTLVPGRYLNGATYRPAHLHVKVLVAGVERLTTQLYFEGDPYNDADPWFDAERMLRPSEEDGVLHAAFDLVVPR